MTKEELDAVIAERTFGHGGPLSRACFDRRDEECGLWGCHCRCHFVTEAQLRRMFRESDALLRDRVRTEGA